jgi:hypothetical protein
VLKVVGVDISRTFFPFHLNTLHHFPEGSNLKCLIFETVKVTYRGADKSLARPGRKQATATKDVEFHISYL